MILFPAIDILSRKAVRLYKGDYNQVTVYSDKPWQFAEDFVSRGCSAIHIVDLDGVILGTAALQNPVFLKEAVNKYGSKIAVGVDLKDGKVAVKGWLETSEKDGIEFLKELEDIGVESVIVTDISRDGAMKGTNVELYERIKKEGLLKVTASGGVSSLEDIKALKALDIYGAIIGKAYYTGAIKLEEALEVCR